MIPVSRPVINKDLDDLRLGYGLSVMDACYLFGLNMGKWSMMKSMPEEPVSDVSLALLVRLLDGNPGLFLPPEYPTPAEMKELFDHCGGKPIRQKTLAIMLGNNESSGYRWLKLEANQKPSVSRLSLYLEKALLSLSEDRRFEALKAWQEVVQQEGYARTGKDVFVTGGWNA